tara:strand:+ start:8766 stop:12176 length:3411 start_codon:yes stop_codon:yes gene_type:complete
VSISLEKFNNESWFKISDYDSMRPFFMSIVSNSNHWMFISSNGGLTAGRKNSQFALFPYYTDDKITELAHTTGSKTIFHIELDSKKTVWEPFSVRNEERFEISRNLYKNSYGNKIMFEEENHDLGLKFSYQWNSSNIYGFVKKCSLINTAKYAQILKVIDGIQNIMPYGVSPDLQTKSSNLVDAYKRSELEKDSGLGIYALSAIIVDKAEPSEALKANVAWSLGLDNPKYLLSSKQLDTFRKGQRVKEETDVKGEKGAYFIESEIGLPGDSEKNWSIVANVNLDHAQLIRLSKSIKESSDLEKLVDQDIEKGTQKLIQLIAGADGLQLTDDEFSDTRHYSNTLFNIMRGGTFDHNYRIEKKDFAEYLSKASKDAVARNQSFINNLEDLFDKAALNVLLADCNDPDLLRLAKEYLPLKFSRRHGDPSRPWNQFSINTHSEIDGSKILDYEGNWRDIFQNWEALVYSYPEFLDGMVFKFLNATTFDGYNPYRVTKDGFDWETIEPDDPWSYIGYWGDHQIIYLLKFLELYNEYAPEEFKDLFDTNNFVYANVPYRIKSYDDITKNPKDTIEFDEESDHEIRARVEEKGADGALLVNAEEEIHRVNFLEKILATVLTKVSNFIPEAGIWMNTQRPEWNDANNALVGNGVSMVTLYYLRRFLKFFEPIISNTEQDEISVSEELAQMFESISGMLSTHAGVLNAEISNKDRREITEGLGRAGSDYRVKVYEQGFSGEKSTITLVQIKDFIQTSLDYLEHSIAANQREDNLYHAYNLMSIDESGISIAHLEEMLEGQVAVLSSGYLSTEQALKVLDALRNSSLYREDQQSYILYPNKELPGFLEKNTIPEKSVNKSKLLQKLVADNNQQIIAKDVEGGFHFNGNFTNARDVKSALTNLADQYSSLVKDEEELVLQIFEEVFNHKAFTGRSGTFFGFEGLGSIYWHMVSKLHLAVQEVCERAVENEVDSETFKRLTAHFDEIRNGIGVHKSPELYGAFPIDPYSHTPEHRGAQQPGMTGQVKEDILVRMGELGIQIKDGKLSFAPSLLKKDEFSKESKTFNLVSLEQETYQINLPKNSIGFTCCQVPVIYKMAEQSGLEVELNDGSTKVFESSGLDKETSHQIFQRSGVVKRIMVSLQKKDLR